MLSPNRDSPPPFRDPNEPNVARYAFSGLVFFVLALLFFAVSDNALNQRSAELQPRIERLADRSPTAPPSDVDVIYA